MSEYHLGVDVGGTFTDFVLVDLTSGAIHREKCLTTPDDPIRGILEGVRLLSEKNAIGKSDISRVIHGTTLVTNTLIERRGVTTGLLTTEGFQDILELGNDQRYDIYDLEIEFPEPLASRAHRRGIGERIAADGSVLKRPDSDSIVAAVEELKESGVESLAVCFLHSYRNSENEKLVEQTIRKHFPDMEVSTSSHVAPEVREYERTITVLANAYVKPIARTYLERLAAKLQEAGVGAPVLVMLSNGGVAGPAASAEMPIRLLESGPAAGVLAACHAGRVNDMPNVLAFDMGGTTAKGCFISGSEPAFTGEFEAARVKPQFRGSGFRLRIPSIELVEIGAGGGSIAWMSDSGLLKVGPRSAGAVPGPVSYKRGGAQPTVTDADLLLGYLDPNNFLGGTMRLDVEAARKAMEKLGAPHGLAAEQLAAGIFKVVNQNMATAFRIHAAERGKDCRQYALFSSGGAGPVHCYDIARLLHIKTILVPFGGGTGSAFGLLVTPAAIDLARSYLASIDEMDWDHLNAIYDEMEREGRVTLEAAGETSVTFARSAEMKFEGQGFELSVTIPNGRLSAASRDEIAKAFRTEYKRIYDSDAGSAPIVAVTWRLRSIGAQRDITNEPSAQSAAAEARKGTRLAYFPEIDRYCEAAVIDRSSLQVGESIKGPALIEERETTLVVGPSGVAEVNPDLSITIRIS